MNVSSSYETSDILHENTFIVADEDQEVFENLLGNQTSIELEPEPMREDEDIALSEPDAQGDQADQAEPVKKTRKRKCDTARWKSNVAKAALDRGEEHFNIKGAEIKGKFMQPPCDLSCQLQWSLKISEEQRKSLYEEYWHKKQGKVAKWTFLSGMIQNFEKKPVKSKTECRRKFTRIYTFRIKNNEDQNEDVRVCKTMFLATFDISDGVVATAVKKRGTPDQREKNKKRPKTIPPEVKASVHEHLESLDKQDPHYVRANSSRVYLTDNIKSIPDLFDLYKEWMPLEHPEIIRGATLRQYTDIFNYETNIGFFVPKKDQCDTCCEWNNSSEEEKDKMRPDYEIHRFNEKFAQDLKKTRY